MKHFFLLSMAWFCALVALGQEFDPQKKYTITCAHYGQGSVGLGAYHSVSPILYYINSADVPDDAYWYIEQDDKGYYTFRNALTNAYITYDSERVATSKKGLNVSEDGSSGAAIWEILQHEGGGFFVRNVQEDMQYFNLRVDGTYLMGTYTDYRSLNGNFYFVDEAGNIVSGSDKEDNGGDKEEEDDNIVPPSVNLDGNVGITDEGLYWECTGKMQVPVLTSTTKDPVYYKIRNNRSGKYLRYLFGSLYQDEVEGDDFYFVKNGSDYNIVTRDGYAVSTYYYYSSSAVFMEYYMAGAQINLWNFGFDVNPTFPGYTVQKKSDLPEYDLETGESLNGQIPYFYWNDCSDTYICLWDVDPGSTFTFYSADPRHVEYLQQGGVSFDGVDANMSKDFLKLVDTLRFNNKDLFYDKTEKCFVVPLPQTIRETGIFNMEVSFQAKGADASTYELRLNDTPINAEGCIVLDDFDASVKHTLSICKDGEAVSTASVRFTYLNLVEVNYPSCNGSYYITGSLRVTQPNILGYDSLYVADFKYRGASAQSYSKKSYAIKMREADGITSKDVEFLGLRSDNNWILDAMAVDPSCMRNRVSTDLWNDFATAPHYKRDGREKKARHGTRGEFAEVYLNGTFHGIYCLTEKMDRKQLKLKKLETFEDGSHIIHGSLYKSSQWSYEVLMGHNQGDEYFPMLPPRAYDNNAREETWANYEIKYPDYEEEPIDWGPLWNAINLVAASDDFEFQNQLTMFFDMPNVVDYFLFIELLLATDNHGKNMFFYNYDQRANKDYNVIGFAPWDLDGTWGRRWDGSKTICSPDQDFTTFLWAYEHGTLTLYHRLQNMEYMMWHDRLAKRYAELRQTHFDEAALQARFEHYGNLFIESGADLREEKRWAGTNVKRYGIAKDVQYIKEWISQRLAFLDEQYGYVVPDGINKVQTDFVGVTGGKGCLYVKSAIQQSINVYNLNGQLVRQALLNVGVNQIDGLTPGIYVVGATKVVVM
ncbi:MAG: CotH kinase family protein [Bacteroidaceae bacterium]|nr:CotH kinase family protein [Bacteroidaceae bacterium]